MEHHDWEWSEDDGGHGDAETADLSGGDDLGGHPDGFTDFGDHDGDLGGHDFGAQPDDLGGTHLSADNLDEPLGTENAVGTYDADIADHDPGYGHDDTLGHHDDTPSGVPGEPANPTDAAPDPTHLTAGTDPGHHDTGGAPGHHDLAGGPDTHTGGAPGTQGDHGAGPVDDGHGTDTGHTADAAGEHGSAADLPPHDPGTDGDHTGDPPGDHGTDQGTDHTFEVNDGHGDATGDHLVGVDPDLDHHGDDPGWHTDPFPPELHLDATPEPVDGFPWVDPTTLGGHGTDDYTHVDEGPEVHEFAQYNGIELPTGGDPWTALFGSDDPATSTLAQWWAPHS